MAMSPNLRESQLSSESTFAKYNLYQVCEESFYTERRPNQQANPILQVWGFRDALGYFGWISSFSKAPDAVYDSD